MLSKSQDKLETLYDELTPNGNNVAIQPIDFSSVKEKDYIDIVKAIKEEYSEINGLVNNAGILGEKNLSNNLIIKLGQKFKELILMRAFYFRNIFFYR